MLSCAAACAIDESMHVGQSLLSLCRVSYHYTVSAHSYIRASSLTVCDPSPISVPAAAAVAAAGLLQNTHQSHPPDPARTRCPVRVYPDRQRYDHHQQQCAALDQQLLPRFLTHTLTVRVHRAVQTVCTPYRHLEVPR